MAEINKESWVGWLVHASFEKGEELELVVESETDDICYFDTEKSWCAKKHCVKIKQVKIVKKLSVKELYEHILKNMSAEQALMKLLKGQAMNYEHLKFSEGEEVHPVLIISMAALDMGWDLAIPDGKDDDEVQGMATGTEEYLEDLFSDQDYLEALELLQYFVQRVEAGTIRSKTTYEKYKNFLDKIQNQK